jgi:hypothetical protein
MLLALDAGFVFRQTALLFEISHEVGPGSGETTPTDKASESDDALLALALAGSLAYRDVPFNASSASLRSLRWAGPSTSSYPYDLFTAPALDDCRLPVMELQVVRDDGAPTWLSQVSKA